MAASCNRVTPSLPLLLMAAVGFLLLMAPSIFCSAAASSSPPKKAKPKQLDFYMLIVVQNLTMLDNPNGRYTAVRSAAPAVTHNFTFGVLNTFDNLLSKTPSLDNPADLLGRVQGWYGDCGQDKLTLCLAQTFTYDDGHFQGTFSVMGVSIATAPLKYVAIVGGTGDFSFCRGVASLHRISDESINNEENAWFSYSITFKC